MEVQTTHMYDICVDVRSHPKRPYALISKCGGVRGPKRGLFSRWTPTPPTYLSPGGCYMAHLCTGSGTLAKYRGWTHEGVCQPPPMVQYGHKAGYFHEGLGM